MPGGVIHLGLMADGVDPSQFEARVRGIGTTLTAVFATARDTGATPLAAAEAIAQARIAAATAAAPGKGPSAVGDSDSDVPTWGDRGSSQMRG